MCRRDSLGGQSNRKKSSVGTFNSGEYVVYPTHGVGKVTNIAKQTIAGSELELLVVNFDKDKMTLRVPMAKLDQVGLRKISDETTMKEALATLKGKPLSLIHIYNNESTGH